MTNQYNQNLCNVCGELECLCRPRFFAGQLLTEEDLNRLDQYIVKKQRLHNRHLHGWGVVSGLELRCHPCDNDVLVTSGYALSPCGDDIVVCEDEQVDICKLIRECLKQEREAQPCEAYPAGNAAGCEDEDWLLMIRYEEVPSRGITALRNATAEARCQPCDGVTFGSCDCDDNGKSKRQSYTTSLRPQPAQCEPTVLCEGYRYEVCRTSSLGISQSPQLSAMELCFDKCVGPYILFFNDLRSFEYILTNSESSDYEKHYNHCCELKRELIDLLDKYTIHNWNLREAAQRLTCPQVPGEHYLPIVSNYEEQLLESCGEMRKILVGSLMDCLHTALLPLMEQTNDPRVVLGRVKVSMPDCKVLSVCNWISVRKFVTTSPNLEYWLSWLIAPYVHNLQQQLRQLCEEDEFPTWFPRIGILDANIKDALPSLLKELLKSNELSEKFGSLWDIISGSNE